MDINKFIEKIRTDPLYRAIVESLFGVFVLWAFNDIWGPTFGVVHSTSGTLPTVLLAMVVYVVARGVYLARKGRNINEEN